MSDFFPAFIRTMQFEVSPALNAENYATFINDDFEHFDTGEIEKWGITAKTLIALKYLPASATPEQQTDYIKGMTLEFIQQFYEKEFWARQNLSGVKSQVIAMKVFDAMTLVGAGTGAMLLQRALGTVADGNIGSFTLRAVNEADPKKVAAQYCLGLKDHLEDVALKNTQLMKFLAGWLNRARWPFATWPQSGQPLPVIQPGVSFDVTD